MTPAKQKIAALLVFRNEELFLQPFMSNMNKIADIVLGYDDGSSDSSKQIFLQSGGVLIDEITGRISGQGATLELREYLLSEGRKRGFSKFIVLDCDEIFVFRDQAYLRNVISGLKSCETLVMKWVMADNSGTGYLNEKSVWSPREKDFAFSDCAHRAYPHDRKFVHFARTPTCKIHSSKKTFLDFSDAFVLHLQFLNWDLGQIKQCWYRLYEAVHLGRSYKVVNRTYSFTKELPIKSLTLPFPSELKLDFSKSEVRHYNPRLSWYFQDICNTLHTVPKRRVRNLDIWHLRVLVEAYKEIYGRRHSFSRAIDLTESSRFRIIHLKYLLRVFFLKIRAYWNG